MIAYIDSNGETHEFGDGIISRCRGGVESIRDVLWYDERKYKIGFLNIRVKPIIIESIFKYIEQFMYIPSQESLCDFLQQDKAYYIGRCIDEEHGLSDREEDKNEVCLARCYQSLGSFYREFDVMLHCHDWGCNAVKKIKQDVKKGIDVHIAVPPFDAEVKFDVRHRGKKSEWHRQRRKDNKIDDNEKGTVLYAEGNPIPPQTYDNRVHFVPVSQYKHIIDEASCPVLI